MKRAEIARKTPMKRTPYKVKPDVEPKVRLRKCAVKTCRTPFQPMSMTHKCCGPDCAILHGQQEKARKERKERQEGLAKLKNKRDHIKEAQIAFNAYIRARDAHQPCISCGKPPPDMSKLHAGRDAGHYRSVGSAPHMRFVEDNCHAQCVKCNQYGSGMAVDYRIALIRRIGLKRVEAVEADQAPRKWSIDDLKAIKAKYRAELKALKTEP